MSTITEENDGSMTYPFELHAWSDDLKDQTTWVDGDEAKKAFDNLQRENEQLKKILKEAHEISAKTLYELKQLQSTHEQFKVGYEQLTAENARLKTCTELLNEPLLQADLDEMIRRLESWGYHVSNRDQFKEMELQRELDQLKAENATLKEDLTTNRLCYYEVVEQRNQALAENEKLKREILGMVKTGTEMLLLAQNEVLAKQNEELKSRIAKLVEALKEIKTTGYTRGCWTCNGGEPLYDLAVEALAEHESELTKPSKD